MGKSEAAAIHDTGPPDKNRPHLFREPDELAASKPVGEGKVRVCGLCGRNREDRIHTGEEEVVGHWGL